MKKFITIAILASAAALSPSCQKPEPEKPTPQPGGNTWDVDPSPEVTPETYDYGLAELCGKCGLTVGASFAYQEYNAYVKDILTEEFDAVTFGNEMKHDAIVSASGKMDFTRADRMAAWLEECGVAVFGHNLGWHQQQQVSYLNGLIKNADDRNGRSLLTENWRFESGELAPFTGSVVPVSGPRETFAGGYSVKAVEAGATLVTPAVDFAGETACLSFWASGSGKVTVASSDGVSADVPVESAWKKYTVSMPVSDGRNYICTLTLPEGAVLDNLRLEEPVGAGPGGEYINPASILPGGDLEGVALGNGNALLEAGWTQVNGADSYVSVVEDAHSGSRAIKMDNSAGRASNAWDAQVITPSVDVEGGHTYRIAWYGKSGAEDVDMQIDIREDGEAVAYRYPYDPMQTEWTYQYYDHTVKAGTSELCVAFYGACSANVFMIDDIQIIPIEAVKSAALSDDVVKVTGTSKLSGEPLYDCMDRAYKNYVYGMVEHFDVYGWDVMNEVFTEFGMLRDGKNTTDANSFLWGDFWPGGTKNFVDKAFAYAADALDACGKTADLYINDYNLESSTAKLNAVCNYAANNPDVTGIGSQMHLTVYQDQFATQKEAIANMLRKMVDTGKLVRISELDIVVGNGPRTLQDEMYVYVFDSYLKIVPEAQRGGITIWGINDKDSWREEKNAPLLWAGQDFRKKSAYRALYDYLLGAAGLKED